jgi:hypothetical protein
MPEVLEQLCILDGNGSLTSQGLQKFQPFIVWFQ